MPAELTLALDVGTHAVKAALVGRSRLNIVKVRSQNIALQAIDARRREQNAVEIVAALNWVIAEVLRDSEVQPSVAGLACQRSTVVAWDRATLVPVGPALSWQDTRAVAVTDRLTACANEIKQISGLVLSPHYGASKIQWLIEHYELNPEQHCVGPLASYLVACLLEHSPILCDHSNANRTQLMNMDKFCWDAYLLQKFAVDKDFLPQLCPVRHDFGRFKHHPIKLTAVAGDQNAAVLASLDLGKDNNTVVNLGSGAFVLRQLELRKNTPARLLSSVLYSDTRRVAFIAEGTVNGAGLALTQFCQTSEVVGLGGESFILTQLPHWLELVADPGCLYLNSCGGLGSPYWCLGPETQFVSSRSSAQQEFSLAARAVAVIESIVFLVCNNCLLLQKNSELETIYLSGGLAQLDAVAQKIADLCQCPVLPLSEQEATLIGAARLAGGLECPVKVNLKMQFQPQSNPLLQQRMALFHQRLKAECSV